MSSSVQLWELKHACNVVRCMRAVFKLMWELETPKKLATMHSLITQCVRRGVSAIMPPTVALHAYSSSNCESKKYQGVVSERQEAVAGLPEAQQVICSRQPPAQARPDLSTCDHCSCPAAGTQGTEVTHIAPALAQLLIARRLHWPKHAAQHVCGSSSNWRQLAHQHLAARRAATGCWCSTSTCDSINSLFILIVINGTGHCADGGSRLRC